MSSQPLARITEHSERKRHMEASGFVDEVRVPSANALEKQTDNPRNGNAGTIDGRWVEIPNIIVDRQPAAGRR
jgi:hypothetical protein